MYIVFSDIPILISSLYFKPLVSDIYKLCSYVVICSFTSLFCLKHDLFNSEILLKTPYNTLNLIALKFFPKFNLICSQQYCEEYPTYKYEKEYFWTLPHNPHYLEIWKPGCYGFSFSFHYSRQLDICRENIVRFMLSFMIAAGHMWLLNFQLIKMKQIKYLVLQSYYLECKGL